MELNKKEILLNVIKDHPGYSSMEIFEIASQKVHIGYSTLKRLLNQLVKEKLIQKSGKGKATRYNIAKSYSLFAPLDVEKYFEKEIDEREISDFNFSLISEILPGTDLFTHEELVKLKSLQDKFEKNIAGLSSVAYQKELERLAIDLSWKSSQIEGNTYSLLETEKLLKESETAAGKTRDEANMLLNHKEAIDFIIANPDYVTPLSISVIEDIHSILIKGLGVDRNLRIRRVGISGTNYQPPDNEFQIREAINDMCSMINNRNVIFEKALLALVLISYIQPFVDGNKRTARIISNAVLMAHGYCPISFRTVDSMDYKKAMLVFYEQNNVVPFKSIFIDQFEFAVNTYF